MANILHKHSAVSAARPRRSPTEDVRIVEKAIAGDADALSVLLRAIETDLRRHIASQIGGRYRRSIEVDDVIQVTYFEAFLRVGVFQDHGNGSFRAWVWHIAENNICDAIRGVDATKRLPPEKCVSTVTTDDSYVDLLIQLGGTQTTPSMELARQEARRVLTDAIAKLPKDYAAVVRLCDLGSLSAIQAAQSLERTPAAVRMLRARAHDRLAEFVGSSFTF